MEVILKLLQLSDIFAVFYHLTLLSELYLLDSLQESFSKHIFAVHQVLFFAENIQIGALKLDPFAYGINRYNFDFLSNLIVPNVAIDSLKKMNIDVIFCCR